MWKKEEVSFLLELYKLNMSLLDISIRLNKSELSIYKKLKRMGKFKGRNTFWTEDEELKLKNLINQNKDISYISKEMNRSINSISKKINRLNINIDKSKLTNWNKSKLINWNEIQEYYDSGKTYKDIISRFKITPQEIIKSQRNGVIKLRTLKEAYENSLITGKRKAKKIDEKIYNDYKKLCSFKFNLNDFNEEFDFNLIEEFGWYKAKNNGDNPNGVSRDHKMSIKYGFENGISPDIISHPANCQLIQQSKNASKGKKNSITLEELMLNIEKWNSKYSLI